MGEYADDAAEDYSDYDCEYHPARRNRKVEFFVLQFHRIKHETKAAYLIEFEITKDLESVEAWLPKSECNLLAGNQIEVPDWLVDEKDLEAYITE